MNLIRKTVILMLLVFIIRTLSSCFDCNCSDDVQYFDFNTIELTNLDNSETYSKLTQSDTLYSKAVAFNVKVFAEDLQTQYTYSQNPFSFSSTYAWSCDCPLLLRANNTIKKISVVTLFDINSAIKAHTDVTNNFVARNGDYYSQAGIYMSIDKLYGKINPKTYYDKAEQVFQLYFTDQVQSDSARFIVNIQLADNTILSDTTNVLTIKQQ